MDKNILTTFIKHDISLSDRNTLGLNANAKNYIKLTSFKDFKKLHYICMYYKKKKINIQLVTIGEGSNIIFCNSTLNSFIIDVKIRGYYVKRESKDYVIIDCAAGVLFRDFVLWCCQENYSGLENLAGIYGTVGAAPVQNIGAYGVQLSDCIYRVKVYDVLTNKFHNYTKEECEFAYRNSIFKRSGGTKIIASVLFKLNKDFEFNNSYEELKNAFKNINKNKLTSLKVAKKVLQIRDRKLPNPAELHNVGSFFQNPIITDKHFQLLKTKYPVLKGHVVEIDKIKISAGWLIEQCGYKGLVKNKVGMYDKQALVLVNYGVKTAKPILKYADIIIQAVKNKFDIILELEPNLIY